MSVKGIGFTHTAMNFPCGEKHVWIKDIENLPDINIEFNFQNNEDIIELLLLCDAVKNIGRKVRSIVMPYVPFSRQDRINILGECFSLRVFCQIINSIDAESVIITDPHSDVTPALINNCVVIPQNEIFEPYLNGHRGRFYLVCPDAGAMKKINKLAMVVQSLPVIECSKIRSVITGEITGVKVNCDDLHGNDCVIVDDICDGGKTFIEIAKVLKDKNAGKVILMVTHGFFTKGLGVFDGLIDEVYTREGKAK